MFSFFNNLIYFSCFINICSENKLIKKLLSKRLSRGSSYIWLKKQLHSNFVDIKLAIHPVNQLHICRFKRTPLGEDFWQVLMHSRLTWTSFSYFRLTSPWSSLLGGGCLMSSAFICKVPFTKDLFKCGVKILWLQRDLYPQPLSTWTNTRPFSQTDWWNISQKIDMEC